MWCVKDAATFCFAPTLSRQNLPCGFMSFSLWVVLVYDTFEQKIAGFQ